MRSIWPSGRLITTKCFHRLWSSTVQIAGPDTGNCMRKYIMTPLYLLFTGRLPSTRPSTRPFALFASSLSQWAAEGNTCGELASKRETSSMARSPRCQRPNADLCQGENVEMVRLLRLPCVRLVRRLIMAFARIGFLVS